MRPLRFALLGTGFWSRYQLAAWNEVGGAECVALYNRTRGKAEKLAAEFGVHRIYDDPCELVRHEELDFLDIVTNIETHRDLVHLAAEHRIPVICQKPMAPSLSDSEGMVETVPGAASVLHPRKLAVAAAYPGPFGSAAVGRSGPAVPRAHPHGQRFRVFENQPFLRELERFLLVDIGSHILDVARFLFGEPRTLYCRTQRIQRDIRGEDLATVMLEMANGATVICEIGLPGTPMSPDYFPQTFAFVEAEGGSVELAPDYRLNITTAAGPAPMHCPPRDMPGPIRPTQWCMPASCRAMPTCWRACAGSAAGNARRR